MEKEPPKWGRVDGLSVGFGDGLDGMCLKSEEVRLIAFCEMTPPSRSKIWWVVCCVGKDERDTKWEPSKSFEMRRSGWC